MNVFSVVWSPSCVCELVPHPFTRWILPSHQPPKSGNVIGAWSYANLPLSSSLQVMNSYVLWQWWTWEIVRKIHENVYIISCFARIMLRTSFLLANWTFINGRFFFLLLINNHKFSFKYGEVRYHYLIDGNTCVMKEKLKSTKLCMHYCWNLQRAKLEQSQLAPSPKLTTRLTWTHS